MNRSEGACTGMCPFRIRRCWCALTRGLGCAAQLHKAQRTTSSTSSRPLTPSGSPATSSSPSASPPPLSRYHPPLEDHCTTDVTSPTLKQTPSHPLLTSYRPPTDPLLTLFLTRTLSTDKNRAETVLSCRTSACVSSHPRVWCKGQEGVGDRRMSRRGDSGPQDEVERRGHARVPTPGLGKRMKWKVGDMMKGEEGVVDCRMSRRGGSALGKG
eukprot:1176047-Prorocentrum_minimum.AAC.4